MKPMRDIGSFLADVTRWASSREDIIAAALVGSFARGTARDDSDIDLNLICETPQAYLDDEQWLAHFGSVVHVQNEDWGLVQSKRVFYDNGPEVELGITSQQWAEIDPVDDGTRRVIADGARILSDRMGILDSLIADVNNNPGRDTTLCGRME
jgi:uncharacterized protein